MKNFKIIELKENEYLLDKKIELLKIINENSLIRAGCGTGKTYALINILKELKQSFIFLVPNTPVKEQLAKDYKITATITEKIGINKLLENKTKYISACYESLKHIKNKVLIQEYIIIIDESHQIIIDQNFRNNKNLFKECQEYAKNTIVLSANAEIHFNKQTYKYIDLKINNFLDFRKKNKLNVFLYEVDTSKQRISKLAYSNFILGLEKTEIPTLFVFNQGIEKIKLITHKEPISAKNKKTHKAYKSLVNGLLPCGLTASTNLFNAGLSIYNESEINLVIDFNGYNLNKIYIEQLISRFRKTIKINVYILSRINKIEYIPSSKIKEYLELKVKLLNDNKMTIWELAERRPETAELIILDNLEYKVNYDKLEFFKQGLNGYKESTKDIIEYLAKKNNWFNIGILELEKIKGIEPQVFHNKVEVKKFLRTLFLNQDENKINDFAEYYFSYRLAKLENNQKYLKNLELNYRKEFTEINLRINQEKKISNTIEKLINKIKIEGTEKTLNNYFKIYIENPMSTEQISKIREQISKVEEDNKRFGQVKKILNNNLAWFGNIGNLEKPSKIKQYLKECNIEIKGNDKRKYILK